MEIHKIEMKRNVKNILVGSCCGLMLFNCSKGNNSEAVGKWDPTTSTFLIEREGIGYKLPTNVMAWAIADPESVPQAMDFFGIDREEEVCVGIFRPRLPLDGTISSRNYTVGEISQIVRELSSPRSGQKQIDEKMENEQIADSIDMSWHFSHSRKIVDQASPTDTFTVYYTGYIFDGQTRPYGLVVISAANPSDSIGTILFDKYISGLTIIK